MTKIKFEGYNIQSCGKCGKIIDSDLIYCPFCRNTSSYSEVRFSWKKTVQIMVACTFLFLFYREVILKKYFADENVHSSYEFKTTHENVKVYAEPDIESAIIKTLPNGYGFNSDRKTNYFVKFEDIGWVRKRDLNTD